MVEVGQRPASEKHPSEVSDWAWRYQVDRWSPVEYMSVLQIKDSMQEFKYSWWCFNFSQVAINQKIDLMILVHRKIPLRILTWAFECINAGTADLCAQILISIQFCYQNTFIWLIKIKHSFSRHLKVAHISKEGFN